MNWLSTKEIKRRAKKSPEEALNVSIQEWEDKCETIRTGGEVRVGGYYCGLCARTDYFDKDCSSCCLDDGEGIGDCCQEYQDFLDDKSLPNAEAMLNRLYCERGKMYGKATKKEPKKEKVELRRGDYGIVPSGVNINKPHFVVADPANLNPRSGYWLDEKGRQSCGYDSTNGKLITDKNNIFDDLKRNAEDLREFDRANQKCGYNKFKVKLCGKAVDFFTSSDGYNCFEINDAVDLHQKLGQLIATAKRDQAKKNKK